MKKFYTFISDDKIEYSKQIEKYLNNKKINILDIQHKIDNVTYLTYINLKYGQVKSELKSFFVAFITYEEN